MKQTRGYLLLICIVSAMGGLLFGYDWVVIGGAKIFYEPFFGIENSAALRGWAMSSALIGCLAGAFTSMTSVHFLCRFFHFDDSLRVSLLPKSVTTPIAMEISSQLSGIPSITVAAVVITGILGSILCPYFIKLFKINNPTIAGVSIGSCSHAVGTSTAVELGEIEGAMSGIAIGISGIITVILSLIFF